MSRCYAVYNLDRIEISRPDNQLFTIYHDDDGMEDETICLWRIVQQNEFWGRILLIIDQISRRRYYRFVRTVKNLRLREITGRLKF